MSAADQYAAACFPDRWRVLGLRLQPFSLGHAVLLQRYCNVWFSDPLNDKAAQPCLADLLLALFICSRSYPRAARDLRRGLGWRWRVLAWRVKLESWLRPLEIASRAQYFRAYLADGMVVPKFWASREHGRPPGASLWADIKVRLLAELHYSEARALDMPLTQAQAEIAALAEQTGNLRLVNQIESEMIDGRNGEGAEAATESRGN